MGRDSSPGEVHLLRVSVVVSESLITHDIKCPILLEFPELDPSLELSELLEVHKLVDARHPVG